MIAATSHYPDFGLTIIKNKSIHLTYRHPTYNKKQPSGHFHQDALSITLSINGHPILVDPGSYLYTANPTWRNFMRGQDCHNGPRAVRRSFMQSRDLFQNQIQEQKDTAIIHEKDNKISIENYYLTQTRKISLERNKLLIEDWVTQDTIWNFIFAPEIEMIRNKNIFLINKENSTFATLESTLVFKPETGFYSESYGKIKKCVKLVGGNKISKTIYHKILITLKY